MTGLRVACIRAAWSLALGALAFVPRAWGQTIVVGPQASSMSTIPGASITVPVVADLTSSGGASLGSIAARLTWRPGTLELVRTSLGSLGAPAVNADSAASGILKFAVANASGATGMPVLINATFNVSGPAADTTTLGFSVGEITAAASFADLKPITSATSARFCVSTGLYGDLDADATLTAHDALIILTNAVGLPVAPYSVVNGDVDGSGVVDSRDALIVLSAAVGIPVSQFRIGRLNAGSCSLRSAATVQIQPRTPSVAPGDSLPVTATVRDSTGAIVQGVGLVWHSKDATIVRAAANGSLVAVAPGSTFASVAVAPGVIDSVPVVVSSVRHVWYVNPAVAAGNAVELGSQAYPFSSIDTALTHAAGGDTVRVAVADYGEAVRITKPLVMLGDSSAAGFPRLSNATAPALRVDSVLAGAVTIRGFRLLNSLKGLVATYTQTLELGSINVEGSRDLGIRVFGVDSLLLAHSAVVGAVGEGIELDSLRTMVLDHVRADVIAAAPSGLVVPVALRIAQVTGTVSGDSITLGTAGARIDTAGTVALRRMRVSGSQGSALQATAKTISIIGSDFSGAGIYGGGSPVSWDSSSYAVSLMAGASVRFDTSKVHDNGLFGLYLTSGGTADSLRADTVARNYPGTSDDASSYFSGFGWLRLVRSAFLSNGPGHVEIEGLSTDSVTADSVVFDNTAAYVHDLHAFRMHGGAVRNGLAPTLDIESVSLVELDSIEASGAGGNATTSVGWAMSAVFVSDADTATVNGIHAHDNGGGALGTYYSGALRVNGGTMLNNGLVNTAAKAPLVAWGVSDARFHGVSVVDTLQDAIAVIPPYSSQTVVDSSVLQGSGDLVGVSASDSTSHVLLYGNRFVSTSTGVWAVFLDFASVAADSNQFAFQGCPNYSSNWYQNTSALFDIGGPAKVTRNAVTGCGALVIVQGAGLPWSDGQVPAVEVRGNTLSLDPLVARWPASSSLGPAIWLGYGLGRVQVVGNAISGGGGGIVVDGSGYEMDSVRVDSNSVRQTAGSGIEVTNIGSVPSRLTYNLVADNLGQGMLMYSPFTATYNTVVRNDTGVADFSGGPSSFRYGNVVGNLPYGVVSSGGELRLQADNNWWGDINGPQCGGCSTSTGDSVSANVMFEPPATAVVALAPPIPAPPPLPAAGFRPLAARSQAVPRAPTLAQGVRRPLLPPRTAMQGVRQPAPRPVGRTAGHHRPAWKTGGQP